MPPPARRSSRSGRRSRGPKPQLEAELEAKRQARLFVEVEMPLVTVLAEMEIIGVRLDRDLLRRLSSELETRLASLAQEIFGVVGHSFNLHSTQQLSRVLFDELNLSP